MSERPFTKLHTPLLDHDKWLGLSYGAKAGWYSLLHLSGRTHGAFKGEAQVVGLLKREGHPDPAPAVAELIEAHLLDEADEGELTLHDFLDWQPLWRGPSDAPEATKARQRTSRSARGVTNGHDSSRRVTRGHEPKRQEGEGDRDSPPTEVGGPPSRMSRGVTTGHDSAPKPLTPRQRVVAWLGERNLSEPGGWATKVFGEMVRQYGADRLIEVFAAGWDSGIRLSIELVRYAEREFRPKLVTGNNGTRPSPRGHHSSEEIGRATEHV